MAGDEQSRDPTGRVTDPALEADLSRRTSSGRWGATLTAQPEERDHALVRRGTLTVTSGDDAGAVHISTQEIIVVGTHGSCDLVLHDASVSRFHCEIALAGKTVVVRDLGSANGTAIDGVPVLEGLLKSGAVLAVGRTELRFDSGGDPVRIELATDDRFGHLFGGSTAMRRLFARLAAAARSDGAVLLEGEPGTGKTAAARSIHEASARRDGPFIAVDGIEIDEALLGAEGMFAAARGGTLYLREVAGVPVTRQARLAALIATWPDVRIVAGTRRSLKREVNARRIAFELYKRVAAVDCRLPSLREHPEDLPGLVEIALASAGAAESAGAERLRTRDVLAELGRRAWPGNVRELLELVERSIAGSAPTTRAATPLTALRSAWNADFERSAIRAALDAANGDHVTAARQMGVDLARFERWLVQHLLT